MNDLETFKEIVRATQGVASDDQSIAKAVAKVRALFVQPAAERTPVPVTRAERGGRNRLDQGGQDRSE